VIIPLRTPDGLPDAARLDQWTAVCDRCGDRRPLGECDFDVWVMGQRTDGAVYCPPCVKVIAAELLAVVFRPGLPARLVHAAGRLVPDWSVAVLALLAALALLCAAALAPRPWRVRIERLARELPRRAGGGLR
jgi:hypothetical protein